MGGVAARYSLPAAAVLKRDAINFSPVMLYDPWLRGMSMTRFKREGWPSVTSRIFTEDVVRWLSPLSQFGVRWPRQLHGWSTLGDQDWRLDGPRQRWWRATRAVAGISICVYPECGRNLSTRNRSGCDVSRRAHGHAIRRPAGDGARSVGKHLANRDI